MSRHIVKYKEEIWSATEKWLTDQDAVWIVYSGVPKEPHHCNSKSAENGDILAVRYANKLYNIYTDRQH